MKIKNTLFAACTLLVMSSCVYSDKNGRKWVTTPQAAVRLPLPRDPLRELIIDGPVMRSYERRRAAAQAAASRPPSAHARNVSPARTVVRSELPPPPAGYMFSSRIIPTGEYEMRGITGGVENMPARDYKEFADECRARGWKIYSF